MGDSESSGGSEVEAEEAGSGSSAQDSPPSQRKGRGEDERRKRGKKKSKEYSSPASRSSSSKDSSEDSSGPSSVSSSSSSSPKRRPRSKHKRKERSEKDKSSKSKSSHKSSSSKHSRSGGSSRRKRSSSHKKSSSHRSKDRTKAGKRKTSSHSKDKRRKDDQESRGLKRSSSHKTSKKKGAKKKKKKKGKEKGGKAEYSSEDRGKPESSFSSSWSSGDKSSEEASPEPKKPKRLRSASDRRGRLRKGQDEEGEEDGDGKGPSGGSEGEEGQGDHVYGGMSDEQYQRYYQFHKDGTIPEDCAESTSKSSNFRKSARSFLIRKDVLLHKGRWNKREKRFHLQRVVREGETEALCRRLHKDLGHASALGTQRHISGKHYWRRMTYDIRDAVETCRGCESNRPLGDAAKKPLGHQRPPREIAVHWAADLATNLPRSPADDFRHIMVVIDQLSRFTYLAGLKDKSSASTARVWEDLMGLFGVNKRTTTDRGTEWAGEFEALHQRLNIRHIRSSPYHPEGNGLCEANVKTVKRMLRQDCAQAEEEGWGEDYDWGRRLPFIQRCLNSRSRRALKMSPAEVTFGVNIRATGNDSEAGSSEEDEERLMARVKKDREETPSGDEGDEDWGRVRQGDDLVWADIFKDIRQEARDNVREAQDKAGKYHDEKFNVHEGFTVGDWVRVADTASSARKASRLGGLWSDPFQVIGVGKRGEVSLRGVEKAVASNRLKATRPPDAQADGEGESGEEQRKTPFSSPKKQPKGTPRKSQSKMLLKAPVKDGKQKTPQKTPPKKKAMARRPPKKDKLTTSTPTKGAGSQAIRVPEIEGEESEASGGTEKADFYGEARILSATSSDEEDPGRPSQSAKGQEEKTEGRKRVEGVETETSPLRETPILTRTRSKMKEIEREAAAKKSPKKSQSDQDIFDDKEEETKPKGEDASPVPEPVDGIVGVPWGSERIPMPRKTIKVTCSVDQIMFILLNKDQDLKATPGHKAFEKRVKDAGDWKLLMALRKMQKGGRGYWEGLKQAREIILARVPRVEEKDGSYSLWIYEARRHRLENGEGLPEDGKLVQVDEKTDVGSEVWNVGRAAKGASITVNRELKCFEEGCEETQEWLGSHLNIAAGSTADGKTPEDQALNQLQYGGYSWYRCPVHKPAVLRNSKITWAQAPWVVVFEALGRGAEAFHSLLGKLPILIFCETGEYELAALSFQTGGNHFETLYRRDKDWFHYNGTSGHMVTKLKGEAGLRRAVPKSCHPSLVFYTFKEPRARHKGLDDSMSPPEEEYMQ